MYYGSKWAADRIEKTIKDIKFPVKILPYPDVTESTNAVKIGRLISGFCNKKTNVALNYTGGTKVMSAFSLLAFENVYCNVNNAFYLDDASQNYVFINRTEEMKEFISFSELALLHNRKQIDYPSKYDADEVKRIFYYDADNVGKKASDKHIDPDIEELKKTPNNISNRWFERLIKEIILCIDKKSGNPFVYGKRPENPLITEEMIITNNYFKVNDTQEFEADITVIHKNRLRYITITVDADKPACKGKMFEAMHRTRQLGGDLATSALVCMMSYQETDSNKDGIDELRINIGQCPRHTAFGVTDVKNWLNGKVQNLYDFLTQ